MNSAQDFNRLYADVERNITQTLADIAELNVENSDGKKHLDTMTENIRSLQERFNHKVSYLKEHAEWDKFTLAFFGETNAGKSTLIETLRILFNEESRQQLLQKNQQDLEKSEQELLEITEHVRTQLGLIYSDIVDKIADLSFSTTKLAQIMDNESTLRLKIEQDESQARLQREQAQQQEQQRIEENESQARLELLKNQTNARARLNNVIIAIVSLAVGAGATLLISMLGH